MSALPRFGCTGFQGIQNTIPPSEGEDKKQTSSPSSVPVEITVIKVNQNLADLKADYLEGIKQAELDVMLAIEEFPSD